MINSRLTEEEVYNSIWPGKAHTTGDLDRETPQVFYADGVECAKSYKKRFYIRLDYQNQIFDPYKEYSRESALNFIEVDSDCFSYYKRYLVEKSAILLKIAKRCR